ncbi:MAG: DNA helicase-2/ATP-dependent DNA helicase PcrA [Candidatus Omnitrophota bacterium]|jgi:DNA helicase-2/ATP-dependent DNA helicase PcrA
MKKYVLQPNDSHPNMNIDYSNELNAEQYDVVKNAEGPCLVLAGAGSGKTRTLIYRVLYLIERGVAPENILLVTFTNKAASEMKSRVEKHLGNQFASLWCGTFHHIGLRILRKYAQHLNLSNNFSILDAEDSKSLLKNCYATLPFKPSEVHFPQASVVGKMISFAANINKPIHSVVNDQYPYFSHFIGEIEMLQKEYTKRKAAASALDFDDLLLKWIQLMQENPDIHERLSRQFHYCFIDEFQDTNALQNRIVELVSNVHKNLLVVGDDAQSIYSFRGAQVQNILDFPTRYPGTKVYKLETNYRSTPEILDLANQSISNNLNQFEKRLHSHNPNGNTPQLIKTRDTRDQSAFVVQHILSLIEEGVSLSAIAVLFRAKYQAAEIELELSRRQIPYVLRGGVRFFEQAHIKDVLAFIKIICTPYDEIAWARAFTLFPGIGPVASVKLHKYFKTEINNATPTEVLDSDAFYAKIPKKSISAIKFVRSYVRKAATVDKETQPDVLIELIMDCVYKSILEERFENASDRYDDLKELAHFAHTYKTTQGFLNDIALKENFRGETFGTDATPVNSEDTLVLSTIHQAKGLEWDSVFILSLAEGHFPHHLATNDQKQLEEERRLFYVASTRAKRDLFLLQPMTRYDREQGSVVTRQSVFLEELPSHVYEGAEVVKEEKDPWDYLEDVIAVDEP